MEPFNFEQDFLVTAVTDSMETAWGNMVFTLAKAHSCVRNCLDFQTANIVLPFMNYEFGLNAAIKFKYLSIKIFRCFKIR